MKSFVFENPVKVYFGQNQLGNLVKELQRFGTRVLMTYGGGSIKRTGLYDQVVNAIRAAGLELYELPGIEPNPRIDSVRKGAQMCKEHKIDVLLSVGGGSTLDATKWIAAGAKADCDPWDMIDHAKHVPCKAALPIVDILTLSATGSEMDNGGVISNPETNEKFGAKSNHIFPKVSFLDPTLTYTVSAFQTAAGSADILSHTMETYFAPDDPMYFLDTVMEGLMKTVVKYAPVAIKKPDNYEARANLMWASSWAINGFVRADKTQGWSCHPMEHELSAFYDITHGLGLAILTPRWMRYCLNEQTVGKYVQFGVNVFGIDPKGEPMAIANEAIEKVENFLFKDLGLKSTLTEVGIDDKHFALMAKKACDGVGGVIPGLIPLKPEDVEAIYRMCL